MSMRSTRAHCTLLARRGTLHTICSSPRSRGHYCICNRNVCASVMALGDNTIHFFILYYYVIHGLWRPRSKKGYDYHAERNHRTLSQSERLVQDTPTCENL